MAADAEVAVPVLAEPLTDREVQVPVLLAADIPNQQIAGELVVALETAKKPVSHILGKLGAPNRTQAVGPRPRAGPAPLARRPGHLPPPPWR
jgi:LuxR family transcriptional regulator, maltose regulon positive regulatory protein